MRGTAHEIGKAIGRLRRSPGYAFSAIAILGFGLGATLYMFTVLKAYMLAPLPYPESDRIMDVYLADPRHGVDEMGVSARDYVEWRESQESFAELATYYTNSVVISDGEYAERTSGAFVTPSAAVALAASLMPALRALRVTPMEALRNE